VRHASAGLQEPKYYSQPYQGWSSTYTVSALLQQLYGFLLLDDSVDQMDGPDAVDRWEHLEWRCVVRHYHILPALFCRCLHLLHANCARKQPGCRSAPLVAWLLGESTTHSAHARHLLATCS
jgi:hypothetical protein